MVFSSITFIFFFLPVTLLLYLIAEKIGNIKFKNAVILVASTVFYSWGGVQYLFLLLMLIAVNYGCGIGIARSRHKKVFIVIGIIIDLLDLVFLKYLGFIIQNVGLLVGNILKTPVTWNIPDIALPLGISFFTFQIMSYLIDVYRGDAQVQKNIFKLALYVMMFPRLVQGPIVRYSTVYKELDERQTTLLMAESGIKSFIIGLGKKVFIATGVGIIADSAFAVTGEFNCIYAWLGAICYTLQIYYDFSGYSDMAIGLGQMFGFHINENFNYPYISKNIQDFWRRWHISLSTWFRDYVYILLGGNRKGQRRTYLNLFIVFLLTGIWHGAAWQFIVWGLYHGAFILIERAGFSKVLKKLPSVIQHVYAVVVVIIGWVFFRADNLTLAVQYIKNMFSLHTAGLTELSIRQNMTGMFWAVFIAAILFSTPVFQKLKDRTNGGRAQKIVVSTAYLVLFGMTIIYLSGLSYNPFIYFKF